MTLLPKPHRRGPKPKAPIARRRRPRSRLAARFGDYRSKVKFANDLWRELVYAKCPNGVCPRCRRRWWHDAAHGWIKGRYAHVRFDPENGLPLCRVCHRIVDSDHQAKESLWKSQLGEARYTRLQLAAISRGKADMDLTILWLESEIETVKGRLAAQGIEWPVRPPREAA